MPQPTDSAPDLDAQAAQWLVRVMSAEVSDADIAGLTAWLDAAPEHLEAYERAEAIWDESAGLKAVPQPPDNVIPLAIQRARKPATLPWLAGIGGLAAACAALVFVAVYSHAPAPAPTVFATAKGERREVILADGTRLHLNTDTQVSVVLSGHSRQLVLDHGEVALSVVHDTARPLTLTAADSLIRDIGTQFDVRRDENRVLVTVAEGRVSFGPAHTDGAVTELSAGRQGVHRVGDQVYTATPADVGTAFAWKSGRAVYRDTTLREVVADLNRYFDKPLVVDARTAQLKLTAVIAIDSEAQVVRSLEAFLPVKAVATTAGIELRATH